MQSNKAVIAFISIILVVAVAAIGFNVYRSHSQLPQFQPDPPTKEDLKKLYDQGISELKHKKYDAAQQSLQKLAFMDPKYSDVQKKLKDATAANLYQKALTSIANKDLTAARDYLRLLQTTLPNYKDTNQLLNQINAGTTPDISKNPDAPAPIPTPTSAVKDPTGSVLNTIPGTLKGYATITRTWSNEPVSAEGTYRLTDPNLKKQIDLVNLTITRFDDHSKAQDEFLKQQQNFNQNNETVQVNGHDAYFGLYSEKSFPQAETLMWTGDRMLYSIIVVPKVQTTDSLTKTIKSAALDIGNQLGY